MKDEIGQGAPTRLPQQMLVSLESNRRGDLQNERHQVGVEERYTRLQGVGHGDLVQRQQPASREPYLDPRLLDDIRRIDRSNLPDEFGEDPLDVAPLLRGSSQRWVVRVRPQVVGEDQTVVRNPAAERRRPRIAQGAKLDELRQEGADPGHAPDGREAGFCEVPRCAVAPGAGEAWPSTLEPFPLTDSGWVPSMESIAAEDLV